MIGRRVSSATYPGRYDLSLHFDGKKMAGRMFPDPPSGEIEHMDVALLAQTGHPYCRQFGELLAGAGNTQHLAAGGPVRAEPY